MNLIGLRVRLINRFKEFTVYHGDDIKNFTRIPLENIGSIVLVEKPEEFVYYCLVTTTEYEIYKSKIHFDNFEIIDDQPE